MFGRRPGSGLSLGCFLMSALALLAAGCAAPSPGNDRENWVCERTADGRDWNCNQQRGRAGASPTAEVATPEAPSPTGAAARPITRTAEAGATAVAGGGASQFGKTLEQKFNKETDDPVRDADKWNATLPALSTGVSDAPLDSPLKPVGPEPRKPPPEPEPFFARWEKKADARALAESSSGAAAAPSAAVAKVSPAPARRRSPPPASPASGADVPAADSGRAYTVQIGAFKSDRAARAYIAQHKLEALPDLVVRPESQGPEHYFLVTFGRFETVKAAQGAWRSSGAASDLEIWIRPTTAPLLSPSKAAPVGDGSAAE